MSPDLQALVSLQEADDIIRGLTAEIQSLPRKVAEIEAQLAEHIAAVEADKAKLADNQRSRRKRESDIAVLREKISKHKDQMLEVKTNEQYKALVHEIEFHESEIAKLEDQILTEMVNSESLEKQLKESEKSLAVERARVQEDVRAAEAKKKQDQEKLQAAQANRQDARKLLSPNLYASYERIATARKGRAVAEVHNGACGACHVCLRPQAYNEVRTNQQILNCESCGCILYYVAPPVE